MTDDVLDLFCEHPDCEDATIEELAAHFEVTCDYYLEDEVDYSYNQPYRQSSYDDGETSDFEIYAIMIGSVGFVCWFLWLFSPVLSCLLAIGYISVLIGINLRYK